ncbi:unnamed protein product [Linum trigynum]|uniref:Uncharacterized protein n=1 Tax=Linum trigynum TaxID=586398 RepID=A0AAV2CXC9_9ROSI
MLSGALNVVSRDSKMGHWHAMIWCILLSFVWKERCAVVHGYVCKTPARLADLLQEELHFIVAGQPELQAELELLEYL